MSPVFCTDNLLHITDLHFWEMIWNPFRMTNKRMLGNINVFLRRRREFRVGQAHSFAQALAGHGAKTVFAGGDFTSTATHAEFDAAAAFLAQLHQSGMQVVAVPGNHDVYTFEAYRQGRFQQYLRDFMPDDALPCRITLPGGTPFILLSTAAPNLLSSCGHISDEHLERTVHLLASTPEGPVLVGAHYPVLRETPGYTTSFTRKLHGAEKLRRVLQQSNRDILYIAGHVHRFSYVVDAQCERIRYVTTPPLFMQRHGSPYSGAFTHIQVHENDFSVHLHRYDGAWKVEKKNVQPVSA